MNLQRQFNEKTLPREFKFKVNKRHLYENDPDYTYTCTQTYNTTWCVHWNDGEKEHSRLYSVKDVLDYVIDLSWIIE